MRVLIGFQNHLMIKNQLKSINPKNNIEISSWDLPSLNDLDIIIKKTAQTQLNWADVDLTSRLDQLKKLTQIINKRANDMSILMADEMGKPKKQGVGEISKCAWLCDYYLENSEQVYRQICKLNFTIVMLPTAQ